MRTLAESGARMRVQYEDVAKSDSIQYSFTTRHQHYREANPGKKATKSKARLSIHLLRADDAGGGCRPYYRVVEGEICSPPARDR